jgi:hypothetical protein
MNPSSWSLRRVTDVSFGVASLGVIPALFILATSLVGIDLLPHGNNALGLFLLAFVSMAAGGFIFCAALACRLISRLARYIVPPEEQP